jgi:nucleotide-binding universal stress UspA family protein
LAQVKDVLFPTDLSEESARAFEHARLIAERFAARLSLYHALVSDIRLYEQPSDEEARAAADAAETKVRARLAPLVQRLQVDHEMVIERDLAVPALADLAVLRHMGRTKPDITVMATHSRQNVADYFVGTVTEQVVRSARRPVLAVRKGPGDAVVPYRRIVVATDLSAASQTAFAWSHLLAQRFSAEVVAVHVSNGSAAAPVTEEQLRAFVAPHHEGVTVRSRVAHGRPWSEIVSVARAVEADMIVIATRGHDSLADDVFGSTTDRVLRYAHCPVCVVG